MKMKKPNTFEELLKSSKEVKDSIKRPHIVKKNKRNLESKILEISSKIDQCEIDKEECLQTQEVDWEKYAEIDGDILVFEYKKKLFQKALEERFPE